MGNRDGIARLSGAIGATLELGSLAAAGGAAALLMWAVLDPVDQSPAAIVRTSSTTLAASPLLPANDPFLRGGAVQVAGGLPTGDGFTLHATRMAASGPGSAILSANGQPQAVFVEGQTISGDARLAIVGPDFVEIERGGRRTRIAFALTPTFAAPPPLHTGDAGAAQLAASMGLRPREQNGRTTGYEISRGDTAVLATAGLRPGDVLVAINGRALNEETLEETRASMLAGQPVEIRFERDGAVQTTRMGTAG